MGKGSELVDMLAAQEGAKRPYGEARVWFDYHDELSHEKTSREGRAQYDRLLVICVQHVGDPAPTVKRARESDKRAYAVELEEFMNGKKGPAPKEGLPLTEWPMIPRSQVKNFEDINVHTVEELADLPEKRGDVFAKLGPAQEWCMKAKDVIETSKKQSSLTALKADNRKLEATVKSLQQQVHRLSQQIEAEQGLSGNIS